MAPAKRARTDGGPGPGPIDATVTAYSSEQLAEMIASLTPAAQAKLLLESATKLTSVADKVAWLHRAKVNRDRAKAAREAATPQDFWHLHDKAYNLMYVKYDRLSPLRQYEKGSDVVEAVDKMLETIAAKTKAESHFDTKINALHTMGQIFSLVDGVGEIPKIVRQNCYDWGPKLIRVVDTFTPEELERLRVEMDTDENDKPVLWMDLFEKVVNVGKDYGLEGHLCTDKAWELMKGGA